MALQSSSLQALCEHMKITPSKLADLIGSHRSALTKVISGKETLTLNLLSRILELPTVPDENAAALSEDWTLDLWPQRAKDLLVIRRRGIFEQKLVSLDEPIDELSRTFESLKEKARGNPALARALLNINRTLDGRTDVAE